MQIRWVRRIETATCGHVEPGQISDVIDADGDRYVRNGWAVPAPTPPPAPASKSRRAR